MPPRENKLKKGAFVRSRVGTVAFLFFGTLGYCSTPTDTPVVLVGLGEQGQEIVKTVSAADYAQSMGAVINSVQSSVEPTLEAQDSTPAPSQKWSLRTIAVGCTITSQIGIGPIWSISPEARLRIIFSNSTSPVYPD
jgi:hypothetical protein